jgi:hypothetical protein
MSAIQTHHFNWLPRKSAWREMQDRRQQRAKFIQSDLDNMDAVNTSMSSALQNNITGAATNAAQAALTRVQAKAKTTSDTITRQIDAAQSVLNQAQAGSTSVVSTTSTTDSSVLDTVA